MRNCISVCVEENRNAHPPTLSGEMRYYKQDVLGINKSIGCNSRQFLDMTDDGGF
jgi:hypothetical protein